MACKACFARDVCCPDCHGELRAADLTVTVVRLVTTRLGALQVHCPTCQALVPRAGLATHVADCPRPCERGCGAQVKPAQAEEHDAVCGAIEAACTTFGCTAKVARSALATHQAQCPFVAVEPAFRALLAGLALAEDEREQLEQRLSLVVDELEQLEQRFSVLEARVTRKRGRPPGKPREPPTKRVRTTQPQTTLASLSILMEKRQQQTCSDTAS
jgi:hypothetical protein